MLGRCFVVFGFSRSEYPTKQENEQNWVDLEAKIHKRIDKRRKDRKKPKRRKTNRNPASSLCLRVFCPQYYKYTRSLPFLLFLRFSHPQLSFLTMMTIVLIKPKNIIGYLLEKILWCDTSHINGVCIKHILHHKRSAIVKRVYLLIGLWQLEQQTPNKWANVLL